MFSCGSHNGFISTINAVLSFQLLFLCFHFYSTVLSLGQAFAGGGAPAVRAPRGLCRARGAAKDTRPARGAPVLPHPRHLCQRLHGCSALNTLWDSRRPARHGQEKPKAQQRRWT